jgi:cyclic pyranopterin monophosphate synthase
LESPFLCRGIAVIPPSAGSIIKKSGLLPYQDFFVVMKKLSHVNDEGHVQMVDVTAKAETIREAKARGVVKMDAATLGLIEKGRIAKGNVLTTAKISGIMAAKKTGEIIPLCHPLKLTGIDINLDIDHKNSQIVIEARARTTGKTGVEMEALTAVSVAALTIYDMCKAVNKRIVIGDIMLLEKSGGKSGTFRRDK